jgi:hypothetical protein
MLERPSETDGRSIGLNDSAAWPCRGGFGQRVLPPDPLPPDPLPRFDWLPD